MLARFTSCSSASESQSESPSIQLHSCSPSGGSELSSDGFQLADATDIAAVMRDSRCSSEAGAVPSEARVMGLESTSEAGPWTSMETRGVRSSMGPSDRTCAEAAR